MNIKNTFLSLLFSLALSECVFRDDYVYNFEVNSWVKLHTVPSNFKDAVSKCLAEGAMLASPTNEDFRNALSSIMANNMCSENIYTGIHSVYSPGLFVTMEGTPVSKLQVEWHANNDDSGKYDCALLRLDGKLVQGSCSKKHPFVCYKEDKDATVNRCGTPYPGYKVNEQTGTCYKYHTDDKSWYSAFKTCVEEGGHLAVINNEDEADFISNLAVDKPFKYYSVFMGFYDWSESDARNWLTVHGETLADCGYSKWMPGEPSLYDTPTRAVERCGSIFRTANTTIGLLNDVPCSFTLPFICERNPHEYGISVRNF